jgi:hypothetical protein
MLFADAVDSPESVLEKLFTRAFGPAIDYIMLTLRDVGDDADAAAEDAGTLPLTKMIKVRHAASGEKINMAEVGVYTSDQLRDIQEQAVQALETGMFVTGSIDAVIFTRRLVRFLRFQAPLGDLALVGSSRTLQDIFILVQMNSVTPDSWSDL